MSNNNNNNWREVMNELLITAIQDERNANQTGIEPTGNGAAANPTAVDPTGIDLTEIAAANSTATGNSNGNVDPTGNGGNILNMNIMFNGLKIMLAAGIFSFELILESVWGGLCMLNHPISFLQAIFAANLAFFYIQYHFTGYIPQGDTSIIEAYHMGMTVLCFIVLGLYKYFHH